MPQKLGPYTLLRPVGHGGTAELYLASNLAEPDSPPLVIKRLLPRFREEREAIELFHSEAMFALRCSQHANVVTTHGFHRDGDEYFIAMDYAPGVQLCTILAETPALMTKAPAAAMTIMLDACAAVSHVHDCGVVHRDVTPMNLLVGTDGATRLIDFGIAVAAPLEGSGHANRGTWAYMSPEQVRGDALDRRSDVFSLGVILWELVAGRRLFKRHANVLTMAAVVEAAVPTLADTEFNAITTRALAKDRDQRLASTSELLEALTDLAAKRGLARDRAAIAAFTAAATETND